jgi:hypothetical protein
MANLGCLFHKLSTSIDEPTENSDLKQVHCIFLSILTQVSAWLDRPLSGGEEARDLLQSYAQAFSEKGVYSSPASLLHDRATQEILKFGIPSDGLRDLYTREAADSHVFQSKLNRRHRIPAGLTPLQYIQYMEHELGIESNEDLYDDAEYQQSLMVQMAS